MMIYNGAGYTVSGGAQAGGPAGIAGPLNPQILSIE